MSNYDVPGNAEELFANGEQSYSIYDQEQCGDNIFAMRLFMEVVDVPSEWISSDDGTQVTLQHPDGRMIVIDSKGLGDFCSHGYDVTVVAAEPADTAGKGCDCNHDD